MAPMVALGVGALVVAMLVAPRRPGTLVVVATIEAAFVITAVGGDALLAAGGALLVFLVAFVIWSLLSATVRMLSARPRRRLEQIERDTRRRARELQRAERGRLAA